MGDGRREVFVQHQFRRHGGGSAVGSARTVRRRAAGASL
jgi:hypothetical protein